MPKIDSFTGCPVMTVAEFWNSEAEQEGKGRSGSEVALDFYEEMRQEEEVEANRIKNNPTEVEALIRRCADDGETDISTISLLEVLEVECSFGKSSKTSVKAKINIGGQEKIVVAGEASYGGSYYEPPDFECFFNVVEA